MPIRIGSEPVKGGGGVSWDFINQAEVRKADARLAASTREQLEANVGRGLRMNADTGLCLPRGDDGFECAFVLGSLKVATPAGPQFISGVELGLRRLQRVAIVGKGGRILDGRLTL